MCLGVVRLLARPVRGATVHPLQDRLTLRPNRRTLKWSSIELAPARNWLVTSQPYCSVSGSMPTALQTLKRPPTQSQKPKAFSGSMPNSFTSLRLVDTATMCFSTAPSPSCAVSHDRQVRALSIVSAVVNVLEMTTTSVSSGLRPCARRSWQVGSGC